jgi:hypothetical protein
VVKTTLISPEGQLYKKKTYNYGLTNPQKGILSYENFDMINPQEGI